MKPMLRADLIVTQAHMEGEIAYTVRDDATGESFRMYAVEYAIAQRLNGERNLDEVIAAVQADLQVQVTLSQLLGFVRELDGRGLVTGFVEPEQSAAALGSSTSLQETATLYVETPFKPASARITAPVPEPLDDAATVASPADAVAAGAFALVTQELVLQERGSAALSKAGLTHEVEVDPQEVQSMLRDAIHRMVGDDVGGAANILHAARALAPQDERVNALVEATQTAYARGTQEANDALKVQSASLFPELMPNELGGATTRPEPDGKHQAPPRRRGLALAAAAVALGLCAALAWVRFGPGQGFVVQIRDVPWAAHDELVGPAQQARFASMASLSFGVGGVVGKIAAPGTRVSAQEVVGTLQFPPALRQHMLISAQKMRQAEATMMRLQRHREELVAQRKTVAAKAAGDKRRGAQTRWKRQLRLIEREERHIRAALLAAQNRRAQANQAQLARNDAARALALVAPGAGLVEAALVQVGQEVEPGTQALRLSHPDKLTLVFALAPNVQGPGPGTEVQVAVASPKGARRVVHGRVRPPEEGQSEDPGSVAVALQGPELSTDPAAYTLVLSSTPKALLVPQDAVAMAQGGAHAWVWQLVEGKAHKCPVAVLGQSPQGLWVAPQEPQNGASVPLIIRASRGGLAALREGALAKAQ